MVADVEGRGRRDGFHGLTAAHVEGSQTKVAGAGQVGDAVDPSGDQAFRADIERLGPFHLGRGDRKPLGELARVKVGRQVDEITYPVQ